LHHRDARLELLRLVTYKMRPQLRPRDQLVQVRHHLATVTHAEGKGIVAIKKFRELVARAVIIKNGFGPALTRAQNIAEGKAATCGNAL
jgi:hypothetical protein